MTTSLLLLFDREIQEKKPHFVKRKRIVILRYAEEEGGQSKNLFKCLLSIVAVVKGHVTISPHSGSHLSTDWPVVDIIDPKVLRSVS